MRPAMNPETTPALSDDSVIEFPEGIIGVPRARRFQLLERNGSTVRVLRCLDIEGFALPVVEAQQADPSYRPTVPAHVVSTLGLDPDGAMLLLAITVLDPDGPHANLRAPVLVNPETLRAMQVILDDRTLPLRAPVRAPGRGTERSAG